MPLAPASKLGPYEIQSFIGAGGMGEVYRALDARLQRTVAMKVMSDRLAKDTERRLRFEQEARLISQISHPNVCAIHDIGEDGGSLYLVMEYLEGETLSSRLAKGALPVSEALRFGMQIADALAQAHRKGVIHRDLKPSNIMLVPVGSSVAVKLLDFGLARHVRREENTAIETQDGLVMGTLPYMAPEQLEGKEDPRTDIFALGLVLHEMLTGGRLVQAKSSAAVIAGIMSLEPPPAESYPPGTPSELIRLIRTCLARHPDERWQNVRDLSAQLRLLCESGTSVSAPAPAVLGNGDRFWKGAAVAAAIALVAASVFVWRGPAPPEERRWEIVGPPGGIIPQNSQPALSPDGTQLAGAFYSFSTRKQDLYVSRLGSDNFTLLPGTEQGTGTTVPVHTFFSQDGRRIGFTLENRLKWIAPATGVVTDAAEAPHAHGGAFLPDGRIVFTPTATDGLYTVDANGGTPAPLTKLDPAAGDRGHGYPYVLPGGKHLLYHIQSQKQERTGVYAVALDGAAAAAPAKRIVGSSSAAELLRVKSRGFWRGTEDYLVFVRNNRLWAQRFDVAQLTVEGDPILISLDVAERSHAGAPFSTSLNGTLYYFTQTASSPVRPAWVDRSGRIVESFDNLAAEYTGLWLSPDGTMAAGERKNKNDQRLEIVLLDLARGASTPFPGRQLSQSVPVFSPDGKSLAFTAEGDGKPAIFIQSLERGAKPERIIDGSSSIRTQAWASDGSGLIFRDGEVSKWLPLTGDRRPQPFVQERMSGPSFSPDGKWLAFRDTGANGRVSLLSFPRPDKPRHISSGSFSSVYPFWLGGGKEVLWSNSSVLQATNIATNATSTLFPIPLDMTIRGAAGDRIFVSIGGTQRREISQHVLVTDWNPAKGAEK